ncbi:tRNA-splicing endonuclease subunit Sen34 isoform X3 [Trichoplusia ni]|nr:tRNA-splicing endonuclease subunit Sen34 isoform X3 [Trichoplusia ni]XP_026731010.1 tRNA-splicing endonuclease subunit Sen34 isoform X3 [Trichoplusia ni]
MALRSEEAALLVEKGICNLFEMPNLTKRPSEEEKQIINELEQTVLSEQTEALKKRKIEQLSQKIEIIVAGKRQKLLSKGVTDIQLDKQTLLQEEINKLPKLAPTYVLMHLPTEHYIPTEKQTLGIDVLSPSVVHGTGAIKYKIFKYLWEKGHHVTTGFKFGCDYLLYPGDPVRFHATYMVRCINDQTSTLSPKEFVAFGRLSVAVNKLAVLAFCNSHGKIECQTLQWHDSVI